VQQLAAVFDMVKTITSGRRREKADPDAISGMVAGLDPHSAVLRQEELQGIS
jgi:hypothetical protein